MIKKLLYIVVLALLNCFTADATEELKVGYASAPPFILEDETVHGISIFLWQEIARDLNIDYKLEEKSFPELLNALESGEIDLVINPLTMTQDRYQNFDFTYPFYASHSVVAKHHIPAWMRFKSLLSSIFSSNFLSTFLVLSFLIFTFGFLTWLFERNHESSHFRKGHKGIWDGIWWSVVTMTTVGYGDKAPKTRGGKITALIWMFSGLLFISGLTATIASSLTVDRIAFDSTKLNELQNQKVGTVSNSSSNDFLRSNFFRKVRSYSNVQKGLDDLKGHRIDAFVYDEPILQYYTSEYDEYANIEILDYKFKVQFYAFGMPHGRDSLMNEINHAILDVIDSRDWYTALNEYGCGDLD